MKTDKNRWNVVRERKIEEHGQSGSQAKPCKSSSHTDCLNSLSVNRRTDRLNYAPTRLCGTCGPTFTITFRVTFEKEEIKCREIHDKTRPYTRHHQSRVGGQGQYGSWAGAVTEICSPFSSKRLKMRSDYRPTDRHRDV